MAVDLQPLGAQLLHSGPVALTCGGTAGYALQASDQGV